MWNQSVTSGLSELYMYMYMYIQGVSKKKGTFLILFLFLFQKLDFTFSHVFWNQNFEPVSSSHSNNTHSRGLYSSLFQ